MRTIKLVKLVRLSVIAMFMSIGFIFLSCSPDELSSADCDCGTVVSKRSGRISTYSEIYYSLSIESYCGGEERKLVPRYIYESTSVGDPQCK